MRPRAAVGALFLVALFSIVTAPVAHAAATCSTYDSNNTPTNEFRGGDEVVVRGTGFAANSIVLVNLQQGTKTIDLARATANDLGAFTLPDATIPEDVTTGDGVIRALDARGSATCEVALTASAGKKGSLGGLFLVWGIVLAGVALVLGLFTYRRWKAERLREAVDSLAWREQFDEHTSGGSRGPGLLEPRDKTEPAGVAVEPHADESRTPEPSWFGDESRPSWVRDDHDSSPRDNPKMDELRDEVNRTWSPDEPKAVEITDPWPSWVSQDKEHESPGTEPRPSFMREDPILERPQPTRPEPRIEDPWVLGDDAGSSAIGAPRPFDDRFAIDDGAEDAGADEPFLPSAPRVSRFEDEDGTRDRREVVAPRRDPISSWEPNLDDEPDRGPLRADEVDLTMEHRTMRESEPEPFVAFEREPDEGDAADVDRDDAPPWAPDPVPSRPAAAWAPDPVPSRPAAAWEPDPGPVPGVPAWEPAARPQGPADPNEADPQPIPSGPDNDEASEPSVLPPFVRRLPEELTPPDPRRALPPDQDFASALRDFLDKEDLQEGRTPPPSRRMSPRVGAEPRPLTPRPTGDVTAPARQEPTLPRRPDVGEPSRPQPRAPDPLQAGPPGGSRPHRDAHRGGPTAPSAPETGPARPYEPRRADPSTAKPVEPRPVEPRRDEPRPDEAWRPEPSRAPAPAERPSEPVRRPSDDRDLVEPPVLPPGWDDGRLTPQREEGRVTAPRNERPEDAPPRKASEAIDRLRREVKGWKR